MNKKKSVICSIFFAIVLTGVFVATWFIETYDGVKLLYILSMATAIMWISDCVIKFYHWLMK